MGRLPNPLPANAVPEHRLPAPEEILAAVRQVLAPLVRLSLASGVDYTRLAAELKLIFVEQARAELARAGRKETDSALSLLSGVHRKDVRAWRESGSTKRTGKDMSIGAQVYAAWLRDRLYTDRRRRPKALPRTGAEPSFDSLARSVTRDVHPFNVLAELLRLGLATVEVRQGNEYVVPRRNDFVPPAGSKEMLDLFSANLSDHALAAVANLAGEPARLEQSVFAEGITEESAARLAELARKLWSQARAEMIDLAIRCYELDKDRDDATARMRFGAYYWNDDERPSGESDDGSEGDNE